MKEAYIKPQIEIIKIKTEGVIASSSLSPDGPKYPEI